MAKTNVPAVSAVASASDVYVRVNVLETFGLDTFSSVVGWIYFAAWTVSFYPQIFTNYRRKRCVRPPRAVVP